ncbi:hypothetical protein LTR66_016779, partial [Elasticomyces elasticus]
SLSSDPSFADAFVHAGGAKALCALVCEATTGGNTLAYALASLCCLLELDFEAGWEGLGGVGEVVWRAVDLVVSNPLINLLRSALHLLTLIVSQPLRSAQRSSDFGFRTLQPALAAHPTFLDALVSRLTSADHALCAAALQLINALMRDALREESHTDWPRFVKELHDLGVTGGVADLMKGDVAESLISPLLDFQGLTKSLLRKRRHVKFDTGLRDHRTALKNVHLSSKPTAWHGSADGKQKHHPEKWRRLGFQTENPAWEFEEMGFLGMIDLAQWIRRNEGLWQKTLLEQAALPGDETCPIARASLAVTAILYEHFAVEWGGEEEDEQQRNSGFGRNQGRDGVRLDLETAFLPLLLCWARLHEAALAAFLRLWKATGAVRAEFEKVEDLVRILVDEVVGMAGRRTEVESVEEEMGQVSLERLRELQMEGLEDAVEEVWGEHLQSVREQLHHEALQFMKEQRIRCLLQGSWFPLSQPAAPSTVSGTGATAHHTPDPTFWRYVRLSHNRRYLHHGTFPQRETREPPLAELVEKIDLTIVTSVVSNVSASTPAGDGAARGDRSSAQTVRSPDAAEAETTNTKITIYGTIPPSSMHHPRHNKSRHNATPSPGGPGPNNQQHDGAADDDRELETVLLELHPGTCPLASEWLDGLLMLLNQQPITADTNKLVRMIEGYGLKIRLLNLRWEDMDWELDGDREGGEGEGEGKREVPSREGLDRDY